MPKGQEQQPQPKGSMVKIPVRSKVELVRETGHEVGHDHPIGHITGFPGSFW